MSYVPKDNKDLATATVIFQFPIFPYTLHWHFFTLQKCVGWCNPGGFWNHIPHLFSLTIWRFILFQLGHCFFIYHNYYIMDVLIIMFVILLQLRSICSPRLEISWISNSLSMKTSSWMCLVSGYHLWCLALIFFLLCLHPFWHTHWKIWRMTKGNGLWIHLCDLTRVEIETK